MTDYKDTVYLPKTDFSMRAGLPTKEPQILKLWEEINLFKKLREQRKNSEPFILHDGPPYANGNLHIGHALNKIIKDISFSYSSYEKMFFDARAYIYIHFFESNYKNLDKELTLYTQNIKGDTLSNYDQKNLIWWKRRLQYHQFVKKLFYKKRKFHFKFLDYYLTLIINFFRQI